MTLRIREAQPRDEARWSELFDGYNRFYGRAPSVAINRHTWAHRGWSRLYWNTKEDNLRARALYDTYTPHSGFVRYVIKNG